MKLNFMDPKHLYAPYIQKLYLKDGLDLQPGINFMDQNSNIKFIDAKTGYSYNEVSYFSVHLENGKVLQVPTSEVKFYLVEPKENNPENKEDIVTVDDLPF